MAQPRQGLQHSARHGFTLVELMIVVAIIAVLSSIAIPALADMQLRARKAEISPNTSALANAAWVYVMDAGVAIGAGPHPRDYSLLDKATVPWGTPGGDWSTLGWAPDGDVRGTYAFGAVAGDGVSPMAATGYGYCDLDVDQLVYLRNVTKKKDDSFHVEGCKDHGGGGRDCVGGPDHGCVCY